MYLSTVNSVFSDYFFSSSALFSSFGSSVSAAFLFFFFFFFFASPSFASPLLPSWFSSFKSSSSSSFSCCFLDFLFFFDLSYGYSTTFSATGSGCYWGGFVSSSFSSSLESSATPKGFLMASSWNFLVSSFSALKPPLTVLICAKSPLNFFLGSKGTMLCSLFLGSSFDFSGEA